jgi:iron-sulfur cluster assembly accessory protein
MISITDDAAEQLRELLITEGKENVFFRIFVQGGGCSGLQYGMAIEESMGSDEIFESNGIKFIVDPISKSYLRGATITYDQFKGFKIDNPNATSSCSCGQSFKGD